RRALWSPARRRAGSLPRRHRAGRFARVVEKRRRRTVGFVRGPLRRTSRAHRPLRLRSLFSRGKGEQPLDRIEVRQAHVTSRNVEVGRRLDERDQLEQLQRIEDSGAEERPIVLDLAYVSAEVLRNEDREL